MGSDSWYLCSHMQGEDRQRPRISASACNCWLEGKNVYLLRDEGASGQTGSPNSCWSSWLRESAGVANTGEEGANSGKAIRASLQGGREAFCLLATTILPHCQSKSVSKGPIQILLIVSSSFETRTFFCLAALSVHT